MTTFEVKETSLDAELENDQITNSIEEIRKCTTHNPIDTSWEQSYYVSFRESKNIDRDKTPPFMSIMIDEDSADSKVNSSTQTEIVGLTQSSAIGVNLSFSKDFQFEDSSSNENDERSSSKRFRHDSFEENKESRPRKKTKCTRSSTSSSNDLNEQKYLSSSELCSESEVSFKSVNSNYSYKTRKRRRKSDSNLFRSVLQRGKCNYLNKYNYSENKTPGSTPRNDKSSRRSKRTKLWRLMDLCTWIGRKGFQSLTGLYADILREPISHQENKENILVEEMKQLRSLVDEVDQKHKHLSQENKSLKEEMKKLVTKIAELEDKISCQQNVSNTPPCPNPATCPPPPPPPPPPLPPPPPPLPTTSKLPVRSNTIPRCGSAPPRIAAPRLTITPEDIANVKLRKAKDNPVRTKPVKEVQQPLVTQHLLEATRAKLGRNRPVAASTPKQQLSDLEKCLLQESSVTSLFRRRVTRGTFRSSEELRVRPYPASRCTRSPCSPRSPRSNSLSRVTPTSPLKFPIICPKE